MRRKDMNLVQSVDFVVFHAHGRFFAWETLILQECTVL
jgi:hypothetical protein